ncbi:ABC transporter substrate-binding protein [Brooklawnia propionicigenes]|uniref:ABC transporter substrate-binding protein n=1 Tax=Brooklawnia propionicigenes TaxID=3041175 RepID=A0AAN0MHK3_9ACTN|nr:substrate-binding domain-containing protein [Brooklawnia sp. SH051]BEH02699.1 ABC transporter substrate-binding protein [Brooklawnia sp. SH051]
MKTRKTVALALSATCMLAALAGCGSGDSGGSSSPGAGDKPKVIIISKSYQNQFYQAAFKGAQDAADALGVDLTTNGPDAESNIPQQVEQLASAVNQRPAAIALAASDPNAVQDTLVQAKSAGIPVIGFDSGVPGDQSGAVVATAATDNEVAGANVATNLLANADVQKALSAGTTDKPAVIGVLAQDSTSGSIVQRVNGFVDAAVTEVEKLPGMQDAVDVSGQEKWTKPSSSPAKVKIVVTVPPTTSQSDIQAAANTILATDGLVSLFAANQDAVNGVISATGDATELNRETGKYKDIFVVGFDAGASQKAAVASGAFLGSVTQDPYQMGYKAVELAVAASKGEAVADVDTGSHWYDNSNITDPQIAILLYD